MIVCFNFLSLNALKQIPEITDIDDLVPTEMGDTNFIFNFPASV